jgi:predicted RNase H-like HicB family nuclease
MHIEIEPEHDGRWIAEVPELPGVLVYGATEAEARSKALALAREVIADRSRSHPPYGRHGRA